MAARGVSHTLHLRMGVIYRFVCFCLLTHFSLSFLSATSFVLVWFYQGSLNTVREFPKFVRHLVRVLKVVLFKIFLDFRFN